MSIDHGRVIGVGLFALLIFASGFWLNHTGKPYNGFVFNIHKLTAVTAVVLFAIALYRIHRLVRLSTVELMATTVNGLLFLGLLVTGSWLSINQPMPEIVLKLHHILSYFAVLSTVIT
jgi:hypothetical protein